MATPTLIYCAGGNKAFADAARVAGFALGARLPDTVYHDLFFADQDFKRPNRGAYMAALARHCPTLASVLDLERDEQLPEVLDWAAEAAQYVARVLIVPKAHGVIAQLPRKVGGAEVILGYSVPTRYAGTEVGVWEFAGWPVHLLGGSPQAQRRLAAYMDVVSVDGNMHNLMATRLCKFFDPLRQTAGGYWAALHEFDGRAWGVDAPLEAFRRSCKNIFAWWHGGEFLRRGLVAR